MSNTHEKYGTYYGKLVNVEDDEDLRFAGTSPELFEEMKSMGVKQIFLDQEGDEKYVDTMFFETDKNTDFKSLMCLLINEHPDEFSEESEHHFRVWFD